MAEWFSRFATSTAKFSGRALAFMIALGSVLTWAICGPYFGFSPAWQMVINTGTTIVTFLMVFLVANTQNRDMTALQLKLDELLRAVEAASNQFIGIEEKAEAELDRLKAES